jgi:hypothetical protein
MSSSKIDPACALHCRPKSGSRRQRIAPILLMLALVVATLGGLSGASYRAGKNTESDLRFLDPRRAPSVGEAVVAYPIEYALRTNERNDVIFVGDSTCRCGVDPAAFERVSGLSAYNLGSVGPVGPMGFLITAKAYLLKHPRPRIMVLCVAPVAFEIGAAETDRRVPARLPTRFEANYGPEVPGVIPLEQSLRYFIQRGSLNFYSWIFLRTGRGESDVRDLPVIGLETETFRTGQRKTREARGFGPLPGLHGKRVKLEWPGQPVKIHSDWDHNVRLLAETCESKHVPLLIRFSPMPSDLSHVKDFSPIERWSQDLQRSYPKLTIGRPNLLWYDWELCYDNLHLNAPGGGDPLRAEWLRRFQASAPLTPRLESPDRGESDDKLAPRERAL